jgi:hypothetical protein
MVIAVVMYDVPYAFTAGINTRPFEWHLIIVSFLLVAIHLTGAITDDLHAPMTRIDGRAS